MNIRFSQNLVRIRLSGRDITKLLNEGSIEESAYFPNQSQLDFNLKLDSDLGITYLNNALKISVPMDGLNESAFKIENKFKTGGDTLTLVIERDFHQ